MMPGENEKRHNWLAAGLMPGGKAKARRFPAGPVTFANWNVGNCLLGRLRERIRRAHVLHGFRELRKARIERLSRLLRA